MVLSFVCLEAFVMGTLPAKEVGAVVRDAETAVVQAANPGSSEGMTARPA
jgi:hypothetical protein